MNQPTRDSMRDMQRRHDQVRRNHLDAVMHLAETEEHMALSFESLADGSSHHDRRIALAHQARNEAIRLREYACRLERQQR